MRKHLDQMIFFVINHCMYKHNFCNGQHVPCIEKKVDKNIHPDKEPCNYFKHGTCIHPNNPKVTTRKRVG